MKFFWPQVVSLCSSLHSQVNTCNDYFIIGLYGTNSQSENSTDYILQNIRGRESFSSVHTEDQSMKTKVLNITRFPKTKNFTTLHSNCWNVSQKGWTGGLLLPNYSCSVSIITQTQTFCYCPCISWTFLSPILESLVHYYWQLQVGSEI